MPESSWIRSSEPSDASQWGLTSPFTLADDPQTSHSRSTTLTLPVTGDLSSLQVCSPLDQFDAPERATQPHIKRPPNAFLLFRSHYCKIRRGTKNPPPPNSWSVRNRSIRICLCKLFCFW